MTCPDHTDGSKQGKKDVGDQHHAIAELNDGVVARALGQQSPYATHNHIAYEQAGTDQMHNF
jgi:hypothetical protein